MSHSAGTGKRKTGLFRQHAVAHQASHRLLGEISLAQPASIRLLTWATVAIGVAIIAFIILGSFTRTSTVSGYLAPDKGLIKVVVPAQATVTQRFFADGAAVARGDKLFELFLDSSSDGLQATQAVIGTQVKARAASLNDELQKQKALAQEDLSALTKRRERLRGELEQVRREAELADQRSRMSQATVKQYEDLRGQSVIPELQLREKQQQLIEHQIAYRALQRTVLTTQRELEEVEAELVRMPVKQAAQMAALERSIAEAQQALIESDAKRQVVMTAPVDGIAAATMVNVGSSVQPGSALVSILPRGSALQAELYASSRAIGFVRDGVKVLLRYQAFPHQQFGHQSGRVVGVSKAPVVLADPAAERGAAQAGQSDSLYRITVALDAQSIAAQGKQWQLSPGMGVEADLLLDKRRLYEWLVEPLQALRRDR
jgi:membrane fusion protein